MKTHRTLTITALLSVGLFTLHVTQDIVHDPNGLDTQGTMIVLSIMLVYLWGILELSGRRLGYALMMLGGLASAYMPFLHTMGPRATRWGFLFIWTMLAMGVVGTYSAILAARELWLSVKKAPHAADTD